MADRQVTRSRKERDGDILALCNPAAVWSPRHKHDAIGDIEHGLRSYFVSVPGIGRADIHVVRGQHGKYLRTTPDRFGRLDLTEKLASGMAADVPEVS